MIISNATKNLLALSFVKGVEVNKLAILSGHNNFDKFCINDITALSQPLADTLAKAKAVQSNFWQLALKEAEEQISWAEKTNTRILSFFDADYPSLLKTSKFDPCILYCQGKLHADDKKSVAVIGMVSSYFCGRANFM